MTYSVDLFYWPILCICTYFNYHSCACDQRVRNAYHGCIMRNSSSNYFIQINQGIKLFRDWKLSILTTGTTVRIQLYNTSLWARKQFVQVLKLPRPTSYLTVPFESVNQADVLCFCAFHSFCETNYVTSLINAILSNDQQYHRNWTWYKSLEIGLMMRHWKQLSSLVCVPLKVC